MVSNRVSALLGPVTDYSRLRGLIFLLRLLLKACSFSVIRGPCEVAHDLGFCRPQDFPFLLYPPYLNKSPCVH